MRCKGLGARKKEARVLKLTKMTVHTNTMYVKKSPGWVNLGEAVSSLLPYVYTVQLALFLRPKLQILTEVRIEDDSKIFPSNQKRGNESP
jgi:hypothetical protein